MEIVSNRISRESLIHGDHIYVWRAGYSYSHHGIYVGEDQVIHFAPRQGNEFVTGTGIDRIINSSTPARSPCSSCAVNQTSSRQVMSHCLDCFLQGGQLRRYKYGVSQAQFLLYRGGTCSTMLSDPIGKVVHRAVYLLNKGFLAYDLLCVNCEDFARYCKTGLLPAEEGVAESGQTGAALSIVTAALIGSPFLAAGLVGGVAIGPQVGRVAAQMFWTTAAGSYLLARHLNEGENNLLRIEVDELVARLHSLNQ